MTIKQGIFTVSLDFELYWGVRDKRKIEQYKHNLQGVRNAIPEMLYLFSKNDIHVTWAIVGFLFFKDIYELNKNIPTIPPTYLNENLSPYKYIKESLEIEPLFHFALDLIKLIKEHNDQEIGTHTFSHYYCLEQGQNLTQFEADIIAAMKIAKHHNVTLKSIVFPRNQWNIEYMPTLVKLGIQSYRGNEPSWMYNASDTAGQNKVTRALRLIDAYFNLSGYNTYNFEDCIEKKPFNFAASRFLRPYSRKLSIFDNLRLKRIKTAMDDAAINKRIFHLWWHPHNFGINTQENIDFLSKIIEHFNFLKKNYDMTSLNMGELSQLAGYDHDKQ